jgi:hypothetical protein
MKARTKAKPPIKESFWKKEEKLYYAEKEDLENLIKASGLSDDILKLRLGAGYSEFQTALAGGKINGWAVVHIENALRPK